jgi:hypothetical protein
MRQGLPTVRIDPPSGPLLPGRGFYQLEEDALFVQISLFTPSRRFFSYIESEYVRFDLDKNGRLLFIEVNMPRRHWETVRGLSWPVTDTLADIRWPDFRTRMKEPRFRTNRRRSLLHIDFGTSGSVRRFLLADNVAIDIAPDNTLAAVWIDDIEDDMAGRCIAGFRKYARRRFEVPEQVSVSG